MEGPQGKQAWHVEEQTEGGGKRDHQLKALAQLCRLIGV